MLRMWKNQSGSVLMEAVIALPLHLMLLLSVVWLGTLGNDRISLAMIENYMIMQPGKNIDELAEFYHAGDTALKLYSNPSAAPSAADGYVYLSENKTKIHRKMPIWLKGLSFFGESYYKGEEIFPEDGIVFSNDNKSGNGGAALLKNPNYTVDRANGTNWAAVAGERFVYGPQPPVVNAAVVEEYTRNTNLTAWGKL